KGSRLPPDISTLSARRSSHPLPRKRSSPTRHSRTESRRTGRKDLLQTRIRSSRRKSPPTVRIRTPPLTAARHNLREARHAAERNPCEITAERPPERAAVLRSSFLRKETLQLQTSPHREGAAARAEAAAQQLESGLARTVAGIDLLN